MYWRTLNSKTKFKTKDSLKKYNHTYERKHAPFASCRSMDIKSPQPQVLISLFFVSFSIPSYFNSLLSGIFLQINTNSVLHIESRGLEILNKKKVKL